MQERGDVIRNPLGLGLLEDGLGEPRRSALGRGSRGRERRRWQTMVRANVQTVRIVVGFGQVVGQLGTVLHVEYPARATSLLARLRSVVSFDFLQGFGCVGLSGFYAQWAAHVCLLPLCALASCILLWRWDARRLGAHAAAKRLAANGFTAVFLLHPTISHWAFAAFDCRQLAPDLRVLRTDYAINCVEYPAGQHPPEYFRCLAASAAVVVLFAFGVPLFTAAALRRKAHELHSSKVSPGVAAVVAAELGLDSTAVAEELIQEVELGVDYGFLLNAFRPSCYFWELLDILRKLVLVGVMVVCVPGSLFQIWVAALLSLLFLAAHFRSWPYKLAADNILKAVVEVLVLVSILVALVLKNPAGLRDEVVPEAVYDVVLVGAYLLVPVAFVAAAWLKTTAALTESRQKFLKSGDEPADASAGRRVAYNLHCSGLADDEDREQLLELFGAAQAQVGLELLQELAAAIEGDRQPQGGPENTATGADGPGAQQLPSPFYWRQETQLHLQQPAAATVLKPDQASSSTNTNTNTSRSAVASARDSTPDGSHQDPFAKFSGGFEGTYADTAAFYGGSSTQRLDVARFTTAAALNGVALCVLCLANHMHTRRPGEADRRAAEERRRGGEGHCS
jgi:hypothetical protein